LHNRSCFACESQRLCRSISQTRRNLRIDCLIGQAPQRLGVGLDAGQHLRPLRSAKAIRAFDGRGIAAQQRIDCHHIAFLITRQVRETAVRDRKLGSGAARCVGLHQGRCTFDCNTYGIDEIARLAGSHRRERDTHEQENSDHCRRPWTHQTDNAERMPAALAPCPLSRHFLTQRDLSPQTLSFGQTNLREDAQLLRCRQDRRELFCGLGVARKTLCDAFAPCKPFQTVIRYRREVHPYS
jgi:hypothetical protein